MAPGTESSAGGGSVGPTWGARERDTGTGEDGLSLDGVSRASTGAGGGAEEGPGCVAGGSSLGGTGE
eukprot:CAMPEP_0175856930 /NCGR_PEP_ID=MMETSP0107_2-20121207/28806_1 /TAXON_ID=195067 ORGANISM="Goniomonas pacifica, Strain CCMP1869" /NCGR_SAMPLE_ID=MMETSP0107_2 /ASSEMBLY_ACC=CAM_ASM_000203 /LENGTH=66 /DNA_ID=CAMNT_0017173159 /DNA_START=176 /DNA_END=374 /DNA_ORIENTATION=+